MSELTTRQWTLYNFLKDQDGFITQYELALALKTEYPCTDEDFEDFHNSQARKVMTEDIRAINKSDVIQKMIISTGKGIKLATEAEASKFIRSKYAAIFRQLERARKLERKAGLDGQLKMVFGSEREIVQAYVDSNGTGERLRLMRKLVGFSQKQAVEKLRKYIHIDEPLLSRIENGVCFPTSEQLAAFEKIYH